jgi:hypothetical protein
MTQKRPSRTVVLLLLTSLWTAGAPQPQEFVITPGADGRPELLQMFLWAFKKTG